MNKAKVIGLAVTGLAVVGGLALFNYYKKPKETRGGFLSMDGNNFYNAYGSGYHCETKNPDGSTTITNSMGDCPKGSVLVKNTPRSTKVIRRA